MDVRSDSLSKTNLIKIIWFRDMKKRLQISWVAKYLVKLKKVREDITNETTNI